MLTHLRMLVHTWWCWHTLRRRWSLKGREGFGFLSPSCRACEVGFGAFEKIKCIFSITSMESLEKSRECFLLEKHSPNDGLGGTGCYSWVSDALSFLAEVKGAPDAQHRTVARHYWRVRWCLTRVRWCLTSARASVDAQGASSGVSSVILHVWQPLYVHVRWVPDASGAHLTAFDSLNMTVRDRRAWFK